MITVTPNNIHIDDSYKVSKKNFDAVLDDIEKEHPECLVFQHRKRISMKFEWATHNALYLLGLWKSHTKDVDINWPIKWYVCFLYNVVGALVWLFIP
jgi:hypothetical protein